MALSTSFLRSQRFDRIGGLGPAAAALRSIAFGLALLGVVTAPALAIDVVSTSPSAYALNVELSLGTISIEFDEAPTLPSRPIRVAGVMSGYQAGSWSVDGNTLNWFPSSAFLPGEKVRVNLHRDIMGTSGSLSGGYYFSFTVASGAATPEFSDGDVFTASIIPYFIHGGDLDEDGRPDLAVPNEGTDDVSVFLNDSGFGEFDARSDYGVGQKPSSIFGEDFNDDGYQDLATADIQGSTVTVLINNGDGTYAPGVTYTTDQHDCRQVHGADFDGDLIVDLVATSHSFSSGEGQIFIYFGFGNGTFGIGLSYEDLPDGSFTVEAEDVNGDGHCDIAVGGRESDLLTVLLNTGGGWFTTAGSYNAGNGPWDCDANDMDGDGDVDMVLVDSFSNRFSLLRNDGNGAFNQIVSRPTSPFPLGVHVADLDGDGDSDVISSNFSGGNAQVFLNDGTGAMTLHDELLVTLTGSYPWAHDLDGDGDLDISVVDENANLLYIFYNVDTPSDGPDLEADARQGLLAMPNPMKPGVGTTLFLKRASGDAGADGMTADVVTAEGRIIRTLRSVRRDEKGSYFEWDGMDRNSRPVAPGRYFVRARTVSGTTYTGEMLVLD